MLPKNYLHRKLYKLIAFILIPLLIFISIITYFAIPSVATDEVVSDTDVMPDKYNTGSSGTLETISGESWTDPDSNCKFIYYEGSTSTNDCYKINALAQSSNNIIIKDKFFNVGSVILQNESKLDSANHKSYKFINCKFKGFGTSRSSTESDITFEHCSLSGFGGCNSTFINCSFGNTIRDGMIPFQNVTVKNCFFSDFSKDSSVDSTTVIHTDGVQTFGYKDIPEKNIHFYNTRFEMPQFIYSNTKAYVNSCLMIANEYSDINDISFEKCYLNGGGYSIYICSKNGWTINNLTLKDIKVGCSHWYGTLYTIYSPKETVFPTHNIQYDVSDASTLYVGSVWKDENNTVHISVTNDTATARTLRIELANGMTKEFNIKASLPGTTFWNHKMVTENTDKYYYSDLPSDIDLTVPNTNWVKCYDADTLIRTQVLGHDIPVSNISLDKSSVTISEGDSVTLIANISPLDATDKSITWSSSNPDVATIENGKIIAQKTGTTIISAMSQDGSIIATCSVTVTKKTDNTNQNTTQNSNTISVNNNINENSIHANTINNANTISSNTLSSNTILPNSINATTNTFGVNTSVNSSSISLNKVDTTMASKTIPQTGIRNYIPFAIAWLIILQIFLFIKIKHLS